MLGLFYLSAAPETVSQPGMVQYSILRSSAGVEANMNRRAAALKLLGVGFFIGGSIVLGVAAGIWLDGKFDTSPVLAIIGLVLGIIIAFYGVYRMLIPLIRKKDSGESE